MMTEAQKKMIAKMRDLGAGYTEVAKQLDLPVGTIKTYCRRNGLTGDRRDTQLQKKSRNARKNGLIDVENRGNSTATDQPESLVNTRVLPPRPTCEITVPFPDTVRAEGAADETGQRPERGDLQGRIQAGGEGLPERAEAGDGAGGGGREGANGREPA